MSDKELETLQAGLRALAREAEQCQPSRKLEGLLRGRFRQHHRARKFRQALIIGSIAACLTMLFAGGTVALRRAFSTPVPVAESRPARTAPVARPPEPERETVLEAPAPDRVRALPRRQRRRAAPDSKVPQPEIPEVMTAFIPVGMGPVFGPGERGSLVRVRLPRSALATFGLPVNENRAADVVKADVLLGDDGVARAIRFIQ